MTRPLTTILADLKKITNYPIYYISGATLLFPEIPEETPFLCDNDLLLEIVKNRNQATAYLTGDPKFSELYYGIIVLNSSSEIVIGPVCDYKLSRKQTVIYMKQYHMHDFMNYQILHAYISQITALIELLTALLFGEAVSIENFFHPANQETFVSEQNLSTYRLTETEESRQHSDHRDGQQMFEYISAGSVDLLKKSFADTPVYEMGTIASTEIKQNEYASVIAVSHASSAAIDGGMNPYDASDLCNLYLQHISTVSNPKEYNQIINNAMIHFAKEVAKIKKQSKDPLPIEEAKTFIIRHLNKPFALKDVAEYVGVSPAYLSNYFSVQTGMTLKEYTLNERIRAAQNMLKFSDYSLGTIANYLCFNSQSYFCAQFKKVTGTTPQQYRKLNSR